MARPGFEKRLRDFLAGEELEEKINRFLKKNAMYVIRECGDTGEFTSVEVHQIWKDYLAIMESAMEDFQNDEKLSDVEFKRAVEDVSERAPMMVKLMIASWEFAQFVEICKEYVENATENEDEVYDEGSDSKYDDNNESKYDAKDSK